MLALGIAHIALRTLLGKRLDESGQYFLLHVLANTYIVAAALPDTLHVLAHPLDALDETDRLSHGTVMAIHLYHVLFFKLSADDRQHHIISVGLVGTMVYMFRWGRSVNSVNFFICGLPGGLDYLLLGLVKLKVIDKIVEKRWNLWLQSAIRYPGILLTLYAALVAKIHHADSVSVGWIPLLTVLILHGWNGLYYAQRVVGNTYVTEKQLKEAKEAKKEENKTPVSG